MSKASQDWEVEEPKKKRGGKRKNSGRKNPPTKVTIHPSVKISLVKEMKTRGLKLSDTVNTALESFLFSD